MPALLAYLIALTVLICGSYSGLSLISARDPSSLTQDQKAKLANRKKFEREAATRLGTNDAVEETIANVVAGPKPENELPKPTAALSGSLSSAAPSPPGREIGVLAPPKPSAIVSGDTKTTGIPATATPDTAARLPTASAAVADVAETTTAAPPAPGESSPTAKSTASSLQVVDRYPSASADNSVQLAAAEKPSRKTRKASQRRKLVLMTLQTIQFADGRLGQRLVPLQSRRQSRTITRLSGSEWLDDTFN
ncbi:MAG: hypothetical protein JWR89_1393 [Tardiphaga sp.]|uniref:hypothetical protein n=1 Tax=Tardiphaga sp. TaxID=1926292 RepID=UPI002608700C|nr:hypothetical protein [Tardiphaga sp.]MDB5501491.1 hypothetical protein [Tardiphaga sp.]